MQKMLVVYEFHGLWATGIDKRPNHRYQKSLNRLLKVCYVPAASAVLIAIFICCGH